MKAHYHFIICYVVPTSFNVVKRLNDKLNAPIPIALEQIRGYYRYFTHKDNPEKHQYDESEIKCLNGFKISDYVELTRSEVSK
ncbi:Rep family protein, partial [Campylobacter concisus]|uniref:Rep family protein n=1 Tax=Campylobacter concisus TaxID=199 RepID=UPI001CA4A945